MQRVRDQVTGSYRYEWALFTDWCAAADVTALPATPVTLAEFLGDNPAGDRVQIRRVAAINRVHRDEGHAAPGRVTALRLALDSVRAEHRRRRAQELADAAHRLPTVGSTDSLFGRRDAVLLLLTAAGLSYRAIAELANTDVTVDDDSSVWIGGDHRLRLDPDTVPGFDPVRTWRRWNEVLVFIGCYPSATLVLGHLRRDTFPDVASWPPRRSPVAAPIDRWGHMPYPVVAMSPESIGDVVAAHRAGAPPRRRPGRLPTRSRTDDTTDESVEPVVPEFDSTPLDTGYYERGAAARRSAHTLLTDVPELYTGVEDRIDDLLARTLELLEQHTGDLGAPETQ